jgi:hypothetical protein
MSKRRIPWTVNLPDGTPLMIVGAIGDVDNETGVISLDERCREVIEEVLEQNPQPTESFVVPGIDLAHEVYCLVQAKHRARIAVHDRLPAGSVAKYEAALHRAADDDLDPDTQRVIDETLRSLYRRAHLHLTRLGQTSPPVSTTQLRESPLGEDLHWLARVARGEGPADQEEVFRAMDSILDLLSWPAGEDRNEVPRAFWSTPLGKMLAEARRRVIDKDDLMRVGDAAAALHVTRPTIYRWLEDQTLDIVLEEASGRTFVLRDQVGRLKSAQGVGDKREVPLAVVDKGQEMSGAARD